MENKELKARVLGSFRFKTTTFGYHPCKQRCKVIEREDKTILVASESLVLLPANHDIILDKFTVVKRFKDKVLIYGKTGSQLESMATMVDAALKIREKFYAQPGPDPADEHEVE